MIDTFCEKRSEEGGRAGRLFTPAITEVSGSTSKGSQGYHARKKTPPPYEHHRSLGIVLLHGPTGWRFLISEVNLSALGPLEEPIEKITMITQSKLWSKL